MNASKADIIDRLQKDILRLNGFRSGSDSTLDINLGSTKSAFPNQNFPSGVMHEFLSSNNEDAAATAGFVSGILASLMKNNGAALWITSCRMIFPPALKSFGIAPDKIIFIDLKKEKEILWVMEEALKCDSLAAVIAETQELSFTASRRLQLAVEQSRVTGFVLRHNPKNLNTTACVTRWKITPSASELLNEMPGVGFPRWNVELLKVRNGKPGKWQIEFAAGRFRHVPKIAAVHIQPQKKAG